MAMVVQIVLIVVMLINTTVDIIRIKQERKKK